MRNQGTDQGLIDWLLAASTPSIRYLTLRNLLDKAELVPEVQAARKAMKKTGPIPEILGRQTRIGAWANEHSYYTPKYTSTHWSLLLLCELGIERKNSAMRRGALYMLGETWDELQKRVSKGKHGLACFWGNLLRYALYCGLDDDPRLRVVLSAVVFDGVEKDWRCAYNDERPCAWGAARALWGFASLPAHLLKPEVHKAIESGVHFLLEAHHLEQADYPTPEKGRVHPMWSRLNAPLFYQADILFVLRVLADLGRLEHPDAQKALLWLQEWRTKAGYWRGTSPYRHRTYAQLSDKEETNRWVSLYAAWVLKSAGIENPT